MLNNIEELELENKKLKEQNEELKLLVKQYEELIRVAKHKQFGSSSEKTDYDQISIFDEVENTADKKHIEPEIEEITYKRTKKVGKREDDLSGLPVEIVEHKLPEDKKCEECGNDVHVMKVEIRRELVFIPATLKVVEHHTEIGGCRNCEKENDHVPIIKAESPEAVIKGSYASASLIASIMVQKYQNAMPLYRQEMNFVTDGVRITRQTMSNWVISATQNWLEPIYNQMRLELLKEDVLFADETVLQVLKEPNKKANTNSYMWLYRTGNIRPIVIYEYQPTRSSSHPKKFLDGYCGYLHTDGYSGYHNLSKDIVVVGCWAHARRKFDEALKALPTQEQMGSKAAIALGYINRLFKLEKEFLELPLEEVFEKRLKLSKPIFEDFYNWLNTLQVLPKSALGKAVKYATEQKQYLENIFLDGRLEISNNRSERSIKPFVIGRKNWLFCNSQKGAKSSSIIYSIIETAKENGLIPFEYLNYLFKELPTSNSPMSDFMPWSKYIPDYCKQKLNK